MKRIFSLLLAAALAAGLLISPAAAASAPWVRIDGRGTNSQTVTVQGLSGSYNGVQLTLNLNKAPESFQFDQALSGGGTYATSTLDGASITVYVASRGPLNQGGAVSLGALLGSESFQVLSVTDVKLLEISPDGAAESSFGQVSVSSGSGAGGTGGGTWTPGTGSGNGDGTGAGTGGGTGSGAGGGTAGTVSLPFTDVREGDWFRPAVAYVYAAGLMNGTGPNTFTPGGTTTRGMIVTILHRLEGSPAAWGGSFPDVAPGQYYSQAVAWAAANGIVNGYDTGLFKPDASITREQMAAILYRYAAYKGYSVTARADLSAYADAGQVSNYALDAMSWANQAGLITGSGSSLLPGGDAIRAQSAAILMRFCQNVAGMN